MSDIHIKQFEVSEQDALLSFLRTAYPNESHKSDFTFWKWHFLENPYVRPDDIPLWVVKSGDKIVGQVASTAVELKLGNEKKHALWTADYYLLPEYRRGGLALALFRATANYSKTLLNLGFNEKAAIVMQGLRWRMLGSINRYHLLLYPGNAAKEISRFAPARHLANILYAPLRPSSARLSTNGAALRTVTKFDASFDELWKDASAQWPCAVVRSSRFLEWQFMRQPGKKYDVLGYYEKDRLLGYIVLFFRKGEHGRVPPKAAISDLCYSTTTSQRVIDTLLEGALRMSLERRAGALVTDVLDNGVEQRLRHFGFRRIKASPQFAAKTDEHQDLIYERSNWFLTRGDSDVSIFEEPNL